MGTGEEMTVPMGQNVKKMVKAAALSRPPGRPFPTTIERANETMHACQANIVKYPKAIPNSTATGSAILSFLVRIMGGGRFQDA
jgi:hypothetical protein